MSRGRSMSRGRNTISNSDQMVVFEREFETLSQTVISGFKFQVQIMGYVPCNCKMELEV